MEKKRIYFDNAATTFPKPKEVAEAVLHYMKDIGCNINRSSYEGAYEAEDTVLETRQLLAEMFNAPDARNVVFTQNVTMSLNMAIKGLLKKDCHAVTSAAEHNAVMRPLVKLENEGIITFDRAVCDACGYTEADAVERCINEKTRVVVISHASNVNGIIRPIEDIGRLCRQKGLLFVVDSAQTAGVLDIDMERMNIDVLCFTGHKGLFGPQGTGGFAVGKRAEKLLDTVLEGGTGSVSHLETMPDFMPDRFEAGTLNIPGIYGLNAGIRFIGATGTAAIRKHEDMLCTAFINGIAKTEGVHVVGRENPGNAEEDFVAVVSLTLDGWDAAEAAFTLENEFGIETRVGLHCAPSAHKTFGTYPEGTVRFSFGYFNTEEEIEHGIKAIGELCKRRG